MFWPNEDNKFSRHNNCAKTRMGQIISQAAAPFAVVRIAGRCAVTGQLFRLPQNVIDLCRTYGDRIEVKNTILGGVGNLVLKLFKRQQDVG